MRHEEPLQSFAVFLDVLCCPVRCLVVPPKNYRKLFYLVNTDNYIMDMANSA